VRTIRLTLAYDGTDFVGWQRQAQGVSVQGLVEAALAPLDDRLVAVAGAGRTDAGVHALGQVASFRIEHSLPVEQLVRAINARLPTAVRALAAEEADAGFHARFSARSKTYRYRLLVSPVADPFCQRFAWHVTDRLDVAAMIDGLRRVEGRHDFSAFRAAGSDVRDAIRTVTLASARVRRAVPSAGIAHAGLGVVFELTGDGFLRHMVRNIVGTLVEIGRGRRTPAAMNDLLAGAPREEAGPTAPPQGLCLVRVLY
jgi:tRNA pseudouridine38-40 synthase